MAKLTFARFKFQVRKKVLICSGQRQTMRGTYYPSKIVTVPLQNRTAAEMKRAMADGIAQLNESA